MTMKTSSNNPSSVPAMLAMMAINAGYGTWNWCCARKEMAAGRKRTAVINGTVAIINFSVVGFLGYQLVRPSKK